MLTEGRCDLNGMWDLASGERDISAIPRRWPFRVPVPGLVDLAPAYRFARHRHHFHRRQFALAPQPEGTEAFLVLEQTMWTTAVWINGAFVGESDDCYLPQRFRLTPHLRAGDNEVVVRIGGYDTLPKDHIGGRDFERIAWIPGIWGDAWIHLCHRGRLAGIQVIPHTDLQGCTVRTWVENLGEQRRTFDLKSGIGIHGCTAHASLDLRPHQTRCVEMQFAMPGAETWHPEHPHLHTLRVNAACAGEAADSKSTRFGLRTFSVRGNQFLLNGEPSPLRGGNIAFHRMLGDVTRGRLPWDLAWARRVLAEIPKSHHMTFFRAHIGPLYHRWYDIADEEGILIQDEWPFWGLTASMPRIRRAFGQWLRARWNHPSIVMWDPGNECEMGELLRSVVPAMKRLDPTRPWAHADADEDHPYFESLNEALPSRKAGFSRPPEAIRDAAKPAIVNEFVWFWFDARARPTKLMKDVLPRWLGPRPSRRKCLAHQAQLAREHVELWRRLDAAAIQPFVYLSADGGCTGHWFLGPLKRLKPKPVLAALREAMAPVGASVEIDWTHATAGSEVALTLHVFNDLPRSGRAKVDVGWADRHRGWTGGPCTLRLALPPASHTAHQVTLRAPATAGEYRLLARVTYAETGLETGVSERAVWSVKPPILSARLRRAKVITLDPRGEISAWLRSVGLTVESLSAGDLEGSPLLVVGEGGLTSRQFTQMRSRIERWVQRGGALILQEPEFGVNRPARLQVLSAFALSIEPHPANEDGADAVVHPTGECPRTVMRGLLRGHLARLNGARGFEMVSEALVTAAARVTPWMVCGMGCRKMALFQLRRGAGQVVINRVQIRGRLIASASAECQEPFARVADPVAQQLFLNILAQSVSLSTPQ